MVMQMNKMLKLRGQFKQKKRNASFGPQQMKSGVTVANDHIEKILLDLEKCKYYWQDKKLINGALISIEYVDIVPKSRRVSSIFVNEKIVGAKFTEDGKKHIITYYIDKDVIDKAINKLNLINDCIKNELRGLITNDMLLSIDNLLNFNQLTITKSNFVGTVVDISNIDKIYVLEANQLSEERKIVSIFETEKDTKELLMSIGIDVPLERIRNTTLLLDPKEINLLLRNAPYLIAMEVEDLSKLPVEYTYNTNNDSVRNIKKPSNEPYIGVIDTPFNNKVYFSDWVDSVSDIDEIINDKDLEHGTGVSSIIVDGPNLNPFIDDGCGNFRVRHFGLSPSGKYSSFKIMTRIEELVKDNPDIKVWNLSLGSDKEIEKNFISPEASILDEIQSRYDVIFIVAGTNMPDYIKDKNYKIGAPADSINSIVVNPVNIDGKITTYSRKGGVLSFYVKPDVCYFGGDQKMPVNVCCIPGQENFKEGTSYAAPWISRKIAYLIHILGFSKEEAKAILIDACEKWNEKYSEEERLRYGHGIVPTNINDIISTPNDEIKFVISGVSLKYDTYNYQLPVPMNNGRYPFAAKATMCYFPKCERNQGVDYTNTEFELKIGRLKNKKEDQSYNIDSINNDLQDEDGELTTEEKARREFRKWDNTKCIKEKFSTRSRDKKSYDNPLWGISVTTKNRLNPLDGENIKFGLVVTLKELHGVNRIGDFIQMCSFNQWFAEEVDVINKLDLYNEAENEIEFE
jgi:hypothetical protein